MRDPAVTTGGGRQSGGPPPPRVNITTQSGYIHFQTWVGGDRTHTYLSYDAARHRYWRIRHSSTANAITWETSGDGVTWVVQRSTAPPFPVTALQLRLEAGKWTNENAAAPGTAIFDNFVTTSTTIRSTRPSG